MISLIQEASKFYAGRCKKRREESKPISVVRSYVSEHAIVLVDFSGEEAARYDIREREGRIVMKFATPKK